MCTLDGYNFMPYFKGEVDEGPREQIFYFGQGGELNAVRGMTGRSTSRNSKATSPMPSASKPPGRPSST